jgi:mono/diheme cytochrome c family protein
LVVAAGCGKLETGDTGPAEPPVDTSVTFADVQEIFDDQCVSCHVAGGVMATVPLTAAEAYDAIVNVPSSVDGVVLVKPQAPDDSYLVMKVRGTYGEIGGGGDSMPPGFLLAQNHIDVIVEWVEGGALP